jgi:uncharacterized protein
LLESIENNPSKFGQFIDSNKERHKRIGLYFEDLWKFWLNNTPDYQVILHNVQVQSDKNTLGAFDLIVMNEREEFEHWELAIKFYLGLNNSQNWNQWVGPNNNDKLSIKLEKMRNKQIELSNHPEGKLFLENQNIEKISRRRIIIKGMFFKQWTSNVSPESANKNCETGIWLEQHQISSYVRQFPFTYRYSVRTKPDWLSDVCLYRDDTEDIREMEDYCYSKNYPMLISILQGRKVYSEKYRLFIVPDGWFS